MNRYTNRLFSSFTCAAALALSSAAALCQSPIPLGGLPTPKVELRFDHGVVPPGQGAILRIRSNQPGGIFALVASERPATDPQPARNLLLAGTGALVARGMLDARGSAATVLDPASWNGFWSCTAFVVTASGAVGSSASLPMTGGGNGGPIGIDTSATVTYSTRIGDSGNQSLRLMTTDENGFVYIASQLGPYVNSPLDADPTGGVWIGKLNPAENGPNGDPSIEWTTMFGGGDQGMQRLDIVAGNGRVFVCGWATQSDLALGTVFGSTKHVFRDGYVAMFDADDGTRLATTYLSQQAPTTGGNSRPHAMALVGDDLFVGGWVDHDALFTHNGFDTTFDGGVDAFVMKLQPQPNGIDLAWSTYLPGTSSGENVRAIAGDGLGNIYVTGNLDSQVALPGPGFEKALGGGQDAFALRLLDGTSPTLVAGTYLGGTKTDSGAAVSLDASGEVWIGGTTASTDFPLTAGAFDTVFAGKSEAFLARLSPDLGTLLSGSFFGGNGNDAGQGLVAHDGMVYLVGQTKSTDLLTVDPLPGGSAKAGREDAFLAVLDPDGQPSMSTYFGGNRTDSAAAGLEVDANGTVYFGGQMDSNDVDLTSPTSYPGNIYVAVVSFQPPPPAPEAPTMLTATTLSSSAIDLAWVDNSSVEAGFRIERSLDTSSWAAVATVGADVTSHTDGGLAPDTTYLYRVVAFNGGGDSPPSAVAGATTDPSPGGTLTITSIAPDSMAVNTTITAATIAGAGFQPGATVTFTSGQGPAPVPFNVVVAASQITLDISAGGGGPNGERHWDVVVTNPDNSSATLPGGFTVIR